VVFPTINSAVSAYRQHAWRGVIVGDRLAAQCGSVVELLHVFVDADDADVVKGGLVVAVDGSSVDDAVLGSLPTGRRASVNDRGSSPSSMATRRSVSMCRATRRRGRGAPRPVPGRAGGPRTPSLEHGRRNSSR
jgi:hypothetical protein